MMRTSSWLGLVAVALVLVGSAPAAAGGPNVEVLAAGLDSPRGLSIGSDGAIYVAEAGRAGDTCLLDIPGRGRVCMGTSGAVSRIVDGSVERVIEGLPSMITGGEVGGPSDVAFDDDDDMYVIVNLGGHPADREAMPKEIGGVAGWLIRATKDGSYEKVADVAAFEAAEDPDGEFSSGEVFSNPHSVVATDRGIAVVDAGGNSLLKVDADGMVSPLAVFEPLMVEVELDELLASASDGSGAVGGDEAVVASPTAADSVTVSVQAVPTSVALGRDGALYVGQLTGGPYPVGMASVWRVDEQGRVERYATGFSNIIDLAFGPDGTLYVAEITNESLASVFEGQTSPIGAVLSVPPGGGDPELVISDRRVIAPGGIAVDEAGAIYVSTGTLIPGGGSIVRIVP